MEPDLPTAQVPSDTLLDRVFTEEATPVERAEFDAWIAAAPEHAERAALWREGWRRAVEPTVDVGSAMRVLRERMVVMESGVEGSVLPSSIRPPRGTHGRDTLRRGLFAKQTLRPWVRYAGVGTALFTLGIVAVVSSRSRGRSPTMRPVRTYATTMGQRATVTLADGSQALLGPATTLAVTATLLDASIDVHVVGQALFTVMHSAQQPFRVHAGHTIARVLGTTFMVRRYDSDLVTRIAVTSGRVSVNGTRDIAIGGSGFVLTAGMLGTVEDSGLVRVTPSKAVEDYMGWTRGELVFRETPVRNVVTELGRAYGVELRVADSTLAARTLDWTVSIRQQSLTDVLEFLSVVLDVHPSRSGRVITLMPGQSASHKPIDHHSPLTSESHYGR